MGMFDYITCKMPLPVEGANALTYQTKRLQCFLDNYEIREDGTLWHEIYDTEDQSEAGKWKAANPGKDYPEEFGLSEFAGCMTRVNKRWERLHDWKGELRFYTTLPNAGWLEWSAYLERGKVVRMNLIENKGAH